MGDAILLYEHSSGDLFLTTDEDAAPVYDVTDMEEPASFEYDAVAVLNGDTEDWTVPLSLSRAGW